MTFLLYLHGVSGSRIWRKIRDSNPDAHLWTLDLANRPGRPSRHIFHLCYLVPEKRLELLRQLASRSEHDVSTIPPLGHCVGAPCRNRTNYPLLTRQQHRQQCLRGKNPRTSSGLFCLVPCVGFDTYKPRTLKVRIHFVLSTALYSIFTPIEDESQEVCEITRY